MTTGNLNLFIVTIIRASAIKKAFDKAPDYKKRPSFSKKKVDSEYYASNEIAEKYHIRRKVFWLVVNVSTSLRSMKDVRWHWFPSIYH